MSKALQAPWPNNDVKVQLCASLRVVHAKIEHQTIRIIRMSPWDPTMEAILTKEAQAHWSSYLPLSPWIPKTLNFALCPLCPQTPKIKIEEQLKLRWYREVGMHQGVAVRIMYHEIRVQRSQGRDRWLGVGQEIEATRAWKTEGMATVRSQEVAHQQLLSEVVASRCLTEVPSATPHAIVPPQFRPQSSHPRSSLTVRSWHPSLRKVQARFRTWPFRSRRGPARLKI